MGESPHTRGRFGGTGLIELTGKILVVTIILFVFVIAFVFCFHLYAKWFWYRRQENTTTTTARRRRRLDFAAGHQEVILVSSLRHGLDPLLLKAIPLIVFDPKEFKDGLECAVCLCEVTVGEKARLLPKCNHGFHVDCIDMWFQSHSTCPLCRDPVNSPNQQNSSNESILETVVHAPTVDNSGFGVYSTEAPNFPTNVLFWGNETQVSTFGLCMEEAHLVNPTAEPSSSSSSSMGSTSHRPDGRLVIDIPRQINEEEEQKSPLPTRLRSLKRLLSGSRRVNPSIPRNLDLEQGGRGQS